MKTFTKSLWVLLLFAVGMSSTDIKAQESTQYIDELRDRLKGDAFSLSAVIYNRANFTFDKDGTQSFSAPHARIKTAGQLDNNFSYKIYADLADAGFVLLDAEISYAFSQKATLTTGAQKPGISYEFLTAPRKLDFVSRSYIVTALTNNRDIGVKLHGNLTETINYSAGIFNGNGISANANSKFNYAGRVEYSSAGDDKTLDAGANFSYGEHNGTTIGNGTLGALDKRLIYGGDVRYENSSLLLATEILAANIEYTGFTEEDFVMGFHLTGGYKLSEKSRVVARFDHMQSEERDVFDQERVVLGYTHFPTGQTGLRINYIIPTQNTDFNNHGIAVGYHIAF